MGKAKPVWWPRDYGVRPKASDRRSFPVNERMLLNGGVTQVHKGRVRYETATTVMVDRANNGKAVTLSIMAAGREFDAPTMLVDLSPDEARHIAGLLLSAADEQQSTLPTTTPARRTAE